MTPSTVSVARGEEWRMIEEGCSAKKRLQRDLFNPPQMSRIQRDIILYKEPNIDMDLKEVGEGWMKLIPK